MMRLSRRFDYKSGFLLSEEFEAPSDRLPRPRMCNAFELSHTCGLGSFPFARRYLGNHCCFLFLRLLRCFSSPRSPLKPMYSATDVSSLHETGFPIQKSPDQSLFSSSPKLIAAYHVFHRLLTPRHPPFALNSLATKHLTQSC